MQLILNRTSSHPFITAVRGYQRGKLIDTKSSIDLYKYCHMLKIQHMTWGWNIFIYLKALTSLLVFSCPFFRLFRVHGENSSINMKTRVAGRELLRWVKLGSPSLRYTKGLEKRDRLRKGEICIYSIQLPSSSSFSFRKLQDGGATLSTHQSCLRNNHCAQQRTNGVQRLAITVKFVDNVVDCVASTLKSTKFGSQTAVLKCNSIRGTVWWQRASLYAWLAISFVLKVCH